MPKTTKSDWLNDYLAERGSFMSGHPKLSEALGVSKETPCSFRFIRARRNSFIFVLTIETTEEHELTAFLGKDPIKSLEVFYNIFGSELNVLFYSLQDFCLYDKIEHSINSITSEELTTYIGSLNAELIKNLGDVKAINRTSNDAFQDWTRSNLSKYCVVNDIDGFYHEEGKNLKFLELKRVKERLESWRPYLDDLSNYRSLNEISNQLKGKMLVYAYRYDESQLVALHFQIDADSPDEIKGSYILASPEYLAPPRFGTQYTSQNRRTY